MFMCFFRSWRLVYAHYRSNPPAQSPQLRVAGRLLRKWPTQIARRDRRDFLQWERHLVSFDRRKHVQSLSLATPADPRGEIILYFLAQLGGEKLLESGGETFFKRPERGLKFSVTFRIVFRILFARLSNRFCVKYFFFSGAISFCRRAALTIASVTSPIAAMATDLCGINPKQSHDCLRAGCSLGIATGGVPGKGVFAVVDLGASNWQVVLVRHSCVFPG